MILVNDLLDSNNKVRPCPVCQNQDIALGECIYQDKIIAYNLYCPQCNFTSRTYKQRHKAIVKWDALVMQCKSINWK